MSTDRNNAHPGRYGSIVFFCDEAGCSEEHDTGYTTWDYAKDSVKREGWYIMPEMTAQGFRSGWLHYCPEHGKARYIQQKNREPGEKADLPWLKNK